MDIKKSQNLSRENDASSKPNEPKQNYNLKYNSDMIGKQKKKKKVKRLKSI